MPRIYTRAQLRLRARRRADMVNAVDFITDPEIDEMLSEHYTDLYAHLVESSLNWFEKTIFVDGKDEPNTELFNLPADFFGMVAVDFQYTSQHFIPLWEYMPTERTLYENLQTGSRFPLVYSVIGRQSAPPGQSEQVSFLPGLRSGQVCRIRYIPAPIGLEDSDGADDGTTIDGVAGWEELVVINTAIDMLNKEESSTAALERKQAKLMDKIASEAEVRAWTSPRRVVDTEDINDIYWWQYIRSQGTA